MCPEMGEMFRRALTIMQSAPIQSSGLKKPFPPWPSDKRPAISIRPCNLNDEAPLGRLQAVADSLIEDRVA
jgi:hypothetical protein